jgi:hypothetical protein
MVWVKCTTSESVNLFESPSPRSWTVVKITTLPNVRFWFYKWFSRKMEFVPDGVLGGYGRGTGVDWRT